jgi:hypothetical protein
LSNPRLQSVACMRLRTSRQRSSAASLNRSPNPGRQARDRSCPRCGAEWFYPESIELSDVEFRCSMSGARFNVLSSRRSPLHKFVIQKITKPAPETGQAPAAEPMSSHSNPHWSSPPRSPYDLLAPARAAGCHGSGGEKLSAIHRCRCPVCLRAHRRTRQLRSARIASMSTTGMDFLVPTVALLALSPVPAVI